MKATRILNSKNLNQGKFKALKAQADLLGNIRSEIWQNYGSISGVGLKDRTIRDQWLKEKRDFSPLSANAWKETIRDSVSDIKACREAAKVKVRKLIRRRIICKQNKVEIHYTIEQIINNSCGNKEIGVDKGFTEVFVDSEGEHYGENLGKIISEESDYLKTKYQKRNKIFQIAKKSKKNKHDRISLHLVNPAYTSQIDHLTGCFTGKQKGDHYLL